MNNLNLFGWDKYQLKMNISTDPSFEIGRVISIKGFKYEIITLKGDLDAELSGKLMYNSADEELPKVGDWVYYLDYDTSGYIMQVLPRTNEVSRKRPGTKIEKQVLATNVDHALIVQGLDRDFNLRRLERYLVQMRSCAVDAIVVLNKSDLVEDPVTYVNQVKDIAPDVRLLSCSTVTGVGIDELRTSVMKPFETYVIVGSSGVGKSSIVNVVGETTQIETASMSDFNNKGRHTTTSRELYVLSNGSLLIDTPGMREFGLTSSDSSDEELFPLIDQFAGGCKFNDCTHSDEAGCNVLAAIERGELDPEVYASYLKLKKEMRRFEIDADEKKRMNKQFGRITREAKDHRKKYKY